MDYKDMIFEIDLKSSIQVFTGNEYLYILDNMDKLMEADKDIENFVNEEIGIVDAPEVEYIHVYERYSNSPIVPGCYVDKSKNVCYMVL